MFYNYYILSDNHGDNSRDFTLKLSDRVNRGTLVTEGVWWQAYTKDGNTNRLTSMRLTDKDGGSTFYDVSVTIEKA